VALGSCWANIGQKDIESFTNGRLGKHFSQNPLWRVESKSHQPLPLGHSLRSVNLQQIDRGEARLCQSDDQLLIESEMLSPGLLAGIEEHNQASTQQRSQIRAFVEVAFEASQREVFKRSQSSVFDSDDVVYLM
jgi:hypothetical protein